MIPTASEGPESQNFRQELGITARLAAPLIVSQAALVSMGLVDAAVVGRYSTEALAGVGIGNAVCFTLLPLAMGLAFALDPLVSQSVGAGQASQGWSWFKVGLRAVALASLPVAAATVGVAAALPWFGVKPALCEYAFDYVLWRTPSAIFFLIYLVIRGYLQANGRTRPLLVSALVANVVNFLCDWVAVFGDGALEGVGLEGVGLPALGARGAAIATSLSSFVMTLWLVPGLLRTRPKEPPPPLPSDASWRVVRLGIPVGLQTFAEACVFNVVAIAAGRLGEVPSAAHQIALQLASFTFMGALGISGAGSVRVGLAVGRRGNVRRAGAAALLLGLVYMGANALIFASFPTFLAGLFTPEDPATLVVAGELLGIAALFQLFDGTQVIMAGALRGAGDVRVPFLASVAAHGGVGLPGALLFGFWLGHGVHGLWYGLTLSLVTVSCLLTARFFLGVARGPVQRVID